MLNGVGIWGLFYPGVKWAPHLVTQSFNPHFQRTDFLKKKVPMSFRLQAIPIHTKYHQTLFSCY